MLNVISTGNVIYIGSGNRWTEIIGISTCRDSYHRELEIENSRPTEEQIGEFNKILNV